MDITLTGERTRLFNESISKSDSYYKRKDFKNAFKALTKATLFVDNSAVQHDYLSKLVKIKNRLANICISEAKPHYESYLILTLEVFALEIAKDLVLFPHLSRFYKKKKNQFSPYCDDVYNDLEIPLDKDGDMDVSMKKLNIFNHRKEMFNEFNNFIYNELPNIYGIPQKYCEDSVNKIMDPHFRNHAEYSELMKFSEELHQKSIDIIPETIHDFTAKLLKMYYDNENT
jgi:hypothetical protein